MKKDVITDAIKKCFGLLIILLCTGCSSAPKRQMVYTDITQRAYDNYEKANASITRGDEEKAGKYLKDAYQLAVSVDKNDLVCKILLSTVSFRIQFPGSLSEDGILAMNIDQLIEKAKKSAALSEEKKFLEAVAEVYEVRGKLYQAKENGKRFANSEFQSTLDNQEKAVSKYPYYQAFLYRTKGECWAFHGDESKAASCFVKAADIHTKNRYLFEIASDWYLAAGSYSRLGNKDAAVKAMRNAIKFDKDAENSMGIAQDYMAVARILVKDNPSPEDRRDAVLWAGKAAEIYESTGNLLPAENCYKWIEENK